MRGGGGVAWRGEVGTQMSKWNVIIEFNYALCEIPPVFTLLLCFPYMMVFTLHVTPRWNRESPWLWDLMDDIELCCSHLAFHHALLPPPL